MTALSPTWDKLAGLSHHLKEHKQALRSANSLASAVAEHTISSAWPHHCLGWGLSNWLQPTPASTMCTGGMAHQESAPLSKSGARKLLPNVWPADCMYQTWHPKCMHVAISCQKRWSDHLHFLCFFVYLKVVCIVSCYVQLMRAAVW